MSLVLGGGVSGLAACHYLLRASASRSVKLIEASDRVGGWIRTTTMPDGVVFEHGPRTVRPVGEAGNNTLSLVEELGLSDLVQPIPRTHPAALNRLIYVNKQLHKLPSSLTSLFVTKPPFSRPLVGSLFHDLWAPRKTGSDESIYSFVERRLGKELADYAISPMICGICAGDAKEISVKFLMKSLFEAEQNHGSITRGLLSNMMKKKGAKTIPPHVSKLSERASTEKWSVWSLRGGLEQLTRALETSVVLGGADVQLNQSCQAVTFTDGGARVSTLNSEHQCDQLYSGIPAARLAALVQTQHPELAALLAAIPMVTVAVVNLQYQGQVLKEPGFGFLVPPAEKLPVLGVIYDSCCFPSGDRTVLTAMMGGRWFKELFGDNPTDQHLVDTATTQIKQILGVSEPPQTWKVSVLKDCIPQYVVGHQTRVQHIRDYIKQHKLPLSLMGSSYEGVSVNDVIMSARRAVEGLPL